MNVNGTNNYILKPQGVRTLQAEIPFQQLLAYKRIFEDEIDVFTPTRNVQLWLQEGQPSELVLDVFNSIIVIFGEGHRIWGRFGTYYAENQDSINTQLQSVFAANSANEALLAARRIRGLGESYATKILRFVDPNYVVLDSILRDELCGREMLYTEFRDKCEYVARYLEITPVDVEAALFAYVQIANQHQRKRRWRQYQLWN